MHVYFKNINEELHKNAYQARKRKGRYSLLVSARQGFSICLVASWAATILLNSASTLLVPRVFSSTTRASSVLPLSTRLLGVSGKKSPPAAITNYWADVKTFRACLSWFKVQVNMRLHTSCYTEYFNRKMTLESLLNWKRGKLTLKTSYIACRLFLICGRGDEVTSDKLL